MLLLFHIGVIIKGWVFNKKLSKFLLIIFFIILFFLSVMTFFKWGPLLTSDTLIYFNLSKKVTLGQFPHSPSYSPGYPFLLALLKNILKFEIEEVGKIVSFLSFLISILISFFIIEEIRSERGFYNNLIASLFLILSWWSVKILFNNHADSIFYIIVLFFILFLIKWMKKGELIYFILVCLIGSISVWIKYNGLVFLPFLVLVPSYYFGFSKKSYLGLIPFFLIGTSFVLFKKVNGGVIQHLETKRSEFSFWQGEISSHTINSNLIDGGKTFLEFIFSSFVLKFTSDIFSIIFFFAIMIVSCYFIFIKRFSKNLSSVLLLFGVMYIFSYLIMSQLTNHTEVNSRTLFPVFIFLFFFLYYNKRQVYYNRKYLIFLTVFFVSNMLRSGFGFLDWYRRAPMDSFVFIEKFKEKESLNELKKIMTVNKIEPIDIYTNNFRYLVSSLDFEWVSPIPEKSRFIRGKIREVSNEEFNLKNVEMLDKLSENKALIILFDIDEESPSNFELDKYKQTRIGHDIIISKY